MLKIKKALLRSKNKNLPDVGESALSEREQLEQEISKLLLKEHPEVLKRKKKRIQLSYSKTKTIKIDPDILKNKHVYALNQDMGITNQIEMLRTQVLDKLKRINANSLMITSAHHGEGKTFISTNLAVSIAQNLNRTVMLIDADLRNQSYKHQRTTNIFFNSNHLAGLSDYLSGKANIQELLVNPGIPRLTLLPSGKALPDSVEFMGSARMEEMIAEMKSRYSKERILILDCSSFLSCADPFILSRVVDAVLLVVENERTKTKSFLRMIDLLKDKTIVGTVLNKTR